MNEHDESFLYYALHRLEATYWHDVDSNGGRTAHEFYVPDGLMVVGENRFVGREKIQEFYKWRANQVSRITIRHLITNLYVASSDQDYATVRGIITFYGGVAHPSKRQEKPPMLVADLVNECVKSKDNGWQFKSHVLQPVFMGHEVPPSLAIDCRD
jgi:hypothetical protein